MTKGERAGNSAIKIEVKEQYSDGFKTIVFPQAKAGIIFLITVESGKFQGVINNATPNGIYKSWFTPCDSIRLSFKK